MPIVKKVEKRGCIMSITVKISQWVEGVSTTRNFVFSKMLILIPLIFLFKYIVYCLVVSLSKVSPVLAGVHEEDPYKKDSFFLKKLFLKIVLIMVQNFFPVYFKTFSSLNICRRSSSQWRLSISENCFLYNKPEYKLNEKYMKFLKKLG